MNEKTRGIGVILGEAGSGKTSSLRAFAANLNSSLFKVIYFPLSTGTVMDFYRGLASGLGEDPAFSKVDLFQQIQQTVLKMYHDKKITPVFILDEMQLVANKFLFDLSILFNFSMDSEDPFILILAGLSYFLDKLSLNQNQSLNQRVVMKYQFSPLFKDEIADYIKHQLDLAGVNHPIFSPQAINVYLVFLQIVNIHFAKHYSLYLFIVKNLINYETFLVLFNLKNIEHLICKFTR